MLLLTFYIREGDTGPIHTVRSAVTTVTSPVRTLGSVVASPFNALGNIARNITAPQETLDELERQNAELTAQVAELSEAEATAERLQDLLDLRSTYNLQSTAARIIGASGDAWSQTVTIDKGSADGLTINMPVCNSAGVIGQIIDVSLNSATVRLSTDENSGISAMLQETRAQGMLQGQPDGSLRLEYVSTDVDVREGDLVITSGLGGVYPKGLLLGTVSAVSSDDNAVYQTIVVTPASRAENNEEVLVITSLTEEQQATDDEVATANSAPNGSARGSAETSNQEATDNGTDDAGDGTADATGGDGE